MPDVTTGDEAVLASARRDFKRFGWAVAGCAVVVLAARLAWGWHWARERAAAEAEFAASGIPAGIEKVPVPTGATKEAADALVALVDSVTQHPLAEDQHHYYGFDTSSNWPPRTADIEFNRPFLKGHAKLLQGLLEL